MIGMALSASLAASFHAIEKKRNRPDI